MASSIKPSLQKLMSKVIPKKIPKGILFDKLNMLFRALSGPINKGPWCFTDDGQNAESCFPYCEDIITETEMCIPVEEMRYEANAKRLRTDVNVNELERDIRSTLEWKCSSNSLSKSPDDRLALNTFLACTGTVFFG